MFRETKLDIQKIYLKAMVEELEQNVRPWLVGTTEAVTLLHSEVNNSTQSILNQKLQAVNFEPKSNSKSSRQSTLKQRFQVSAQQPDCLAKVALTCYCRQVKKQKNKKMWKKMSQYV